ncbi:MAG: hypothetical protein ABSG74_03865 [Candidatus Bathyarchaeia archaeon]|jgi:hypothetical protein
MRIVALSALAIFVSLSVIFGVSLIMRATFFILPYSMTGFPIVVDVLRVLLALALAYSWLRGVKAIADWYFWRSVSLRGRDES